MENNPDPSASNENPQNTEVVTPLVQPTSTQTVSEPSSLPTDSSTATPTSDTSAPVVTTPVNNDKTGKNHAWLWIIVIVVLLLVGGGLWYWHHKNAKPTVTTKILPISNLRIGTEEGPLGDDNLFPNPPAASGSQDVDFQLFEGLVTYKSQRIVPLLATSWTNPDKNTWIFQLAKNVKFHNGQTMTAQDVVTSVETDMQSDYWSSYSSTISTIKATGTNEVTITTTQPDALLLDHLAYTFIYRTGSDKKLYGTGPYIVDTTKPDTENTMTLKAFSGYHGSTPLTKSATYTIYDSPDSIIKAYKANKIDTFDDSLTADQIASLKGNGSTYTYQHAGSYGLNMNMTRKGGIMTNPKIREALAYSINRSALIKQLGEPDEPTQTIIPKTVVGYDASATFPGLDIAKAKQLQTDAGYPNGAPVTFVYIQGLQADPPVLIDQLKAAGFQVTAKVMTNPADMVSTINAGNYDLFTNSDYSDYNDGTALFSQILDSRSSLYPLYNNPSYDALIDAATQEFEPTAHIKKVQQINDFIASNYLWIPIRTTWGDYYTHSGYQVAENFNLVTNSIGLASTGQLVKTSK